MARFDFARCWGEVAKYRYGIQIDACEPDGFDASKTTKRATPNSAPHAIDVFEPCIDSQSILLRGKLSETAQSDSANYSALTPLFRIWSK